MAIAMRMIARAVAAAAVCVGFSIGASPAGAGPVSGVVRTVGRPGVAPAASLVYAERIDTAAPRQAGRFTLRQKNKTFTPRLMGVPVGAAVEFPNDDSIFHNVFSLSGPQPFDLGQYRSGESQSRTFSQAGTYRVFCNIHPNMSALILVVPTPYVVAHRRGWPVLCSIFLPAVTGSPPSRSARNRCPSTSQLKAAPHRRSR